MLSIRNKASQDQPVIYARTSMALLKIRLKPSHLLVCQPVSVPHQSGFMHGLHPNYHSKSVGPEPEEGLLPCPFGRRL